MAYVKPQVLVFQEFTIVPTEITEPLRAHIAGPHAVLHRYNNADEKALSRLGVYNYLADTCYAWPQRLAGSRVDMDYVKLYADNALLLYYSETIDNVAVVTRPTRGKSNWIESVAGTGEGATAIHYRSNGTASGRSDVFKDRDVKVGDVVYLRSVADDEECTETTLWTTVAGFASTTIQSEIENATADANNSGNVSAAANSVKLSGAINRVRIANVDGGDYSGVEDGVLSETYTVEVVASSTSGCNAARLRVRSASRLDDVAEVTPPAFGNQVSIGTRGLKVTFSNAEEGAPDPSTYTAGVATDAFVVGQKWSITVSQAFAEVTAISNNGNSNAAGSYTGDKNDTYIIECVKGGYIEEGGTNFPQITVRTAKGLDFSGPVEIVNSGDTAGAFFPIGSHGVAVAFVATGAMSMSAPGSSPVTSMRKGDKWYIKVVSSAAGAVNKLILRDDLPAAMRAVVTVGEGGAETVTYPAMDIQLFIKSDIEISENRLGYAPLVNYTKEDTQICVKADAVAYHPEWTLAGVEQPLPVRGGTLYVQYREWVSELCDEVNSISSVADLDNIRGQLDPDNPLKWGVYKALSNSNGTVVKYTAVCEPDDLDSWVQVLERVKGRDDLYNLVPLTFNTQVHDLFAAHIVDESNELANNWKAGFFGIASRSSKMLVGEGAPISGVSGEVIAAPVLATLSDDPSATGTQYTLLQVPTGVGYFITNNVQAGDIVRYEYTVDGFGVAKYDEYVVDAVLSENTLRLYSGADLPVTQPQRVEIWHNMNRNEMADDIAERAGALSSRRICAVWPDQVGSAGTLQPGYFLAAALAGLVSGVVPHQGLTNVEVAGFDDYTRSYKMFNETQLNRMAEAGVWIVTEDRDGTPYTRHAVTTDNLDLNRREEMIRRNVDSLSYLFLRRLRPYIGRTNATAGMVDYLRNRLSEVIDFLKASGYTQELGSQLTDASIRVLRIHPLLKDRIEIVLDLVVPAPLNNIELHLVV